MDVEITNQMTQNQEAIKIMAKNKQPALIQWTIYHTMRFVLVTNKQNPSTNAYAVPPTNLLKIFRVKNTYKHLKSRRIF